MAPKPEAFRDPISTPSRDYSRSNFRESVSELEAMRRRERRRRGAEERETLALEQRREKQSSREEETEERERGATPRSRGGERDRSPIKICHAMKSLDEANNEPEQNLGREEVIAAIEESFEEEEDEEEVEDKPMDIEQEIVDTDQPPPEPCKKKLQSIITKPQESPKKHISTLMMREFRNYVLALPPILSFEGAWQSKSMHKFFEKSDETKQEIKHYFERARASSRPRETRGHRYQKHDRVLNWVDIRTLGEFNAKVQSLPAGMPFDKALMRYDLLSYFRYSRETLNEVKEYYDQARALPWKTLVKAEDKGSFLISCWMRGVEFKDVLCDSGSPVNVMSEEVAKKIGLKELKPSKIKIAFTNSSITKPKGEIEDLYVRIGTCNIPTDFQVMKVDIGEIPQIILGGGFLSTVGAIMDWSKGRVSFAHIDKNTFYDIVPHKEKEERGATKKRFEDQAEANLKTRPKKTCLRTPSSPS